MEPGSLSSIVWLVKLYLVSQPFAIVALPNFQMNLLEGYKSRILLFNSIRWDESHWVRSFYFRASLKASSLRILILSY